MSVDKTFLLLVNCHHEHIDFYVPPGSWTVMVDTNEPEMDPGSVTIGENAPVRLVRQSLMLLREDMPVQ